MPVTPRHRGHATAALLLLAGLAACAAPTTHDGTQLAEQTVQSIRRLGDEADEVCRQSQPERAAAKILQRAQLWQLRWSGEAGAPVSRPLLDGYYYASLAVAFHNTSAICDAMVPNLSKLAVSYLQAYVDEPSYPESRITLLQRADAYGMIDRVGAWAGLHPMTLATFAERRTRFRARAED